MRTLKVLLCMSILWGGTSIVCAQFHSYGLDNLSEYVMTQYTIARMAEDENLTNLIKEVLESGVQTPLSYTIKTSIVSPGKEGFVKTTKDYSKNGKIQGWEYAKGSEHYILLYQSDWEDIYTECMPKRITRLLGTYIIDQTIETDKHIYHNKANDLLKSRNHKIEDKEYTLIFL